MWLHARDGMFSFARCNHSVEEKKKKNEEEKFP
jgi:hypothetical protein